MKATANLTEYTDCIQVEVKLKNRRVLVIRNFDGVYLIRFRRLDESKGASLEEDLGKGIFDVYLKLSNEAALAVSYAINTIENYVKENNL